MQLAPLDQPAPVIAELGSTRDRLLDAAYRVCARDGLHAATTRSIAVEAGVNEVTLFRQFGSKEKLIGAMLQRAMAAQVGALEEANAEPSTDDLRNDLLRYGRRLSEVLFSNEPLIRTLIGEARRHPEPSKQIIYETIRPMRQRVIDYIKSAQAAGSVREIEHVSAVVDAFTGMLLSGMLRRTSMCHELDYSSDDYLAVCVDLFVAGISSRDGGASRRRPRKEKS